MWRRMRPGDGGGVISGSARVLAFLRLTERMTVSGGAVSASSWSVIEAIGTTGWETLVAAESRGLEAWLRLVLTAEREGEAAWGTTWRELGERSTSVGAGLTGACSEGEVRLGALDFVT